MRATSVDLGGELAARFSSAAKVRARTAAAEQRLGSPSEGSLSARGASAEPDEEAERAAYATETLTLTLSLTLSLTLTLSRALTRYETETLLDELAAILRGAAQWDAYMAQRVAKVNPTPITNPNPNDATVLCGDRCSWRCV